MAQEGYASVEFWLGRLRPKTVVVNKYHFNRFIGWLSENGGKFSAFTPDQLVAFQKQVIGDERFEILDVVQKYVGTIEGRYGYKVKVYSTFKSFFAHNRAELPRDMTFRINGDTPKVVGTLKPEEIKEIVLSSNEAYRAAFLCMIQGGIDRESFTWWNLNGWEKLKEDLRNDPKMIRIDLPGRKKVRNERPYYTLIGPDAIEAIRKWLPLRPEGANAIFTDQLKKPVSSNALKQYWDRHLEKLGIIKKIRTTKARGGWVRYGKNPHEMRDVFRSLWEKSTAKSSVAEFLMGHFNKVDPMEYNKAFQDDKWVHKEYEKALPFLQIMSSGRPFGQVSEDEVERLREEVEILKAGKDERIQKLEADLEKQKKMLELLYEKLKNE